MDAADRFPAPLADHLAAPRHARPLPDADGHARITGPCGDTMECWLRVEERMIRAIGLVSDGCDHSRACASAAAELALARGDLEAAIALGAVEVDAALGGLPPEHAHCVHLAVRTLRWACGDCIARSGGRR